MQCKICGKENPDNVDFCVSCGGTLSGSASVDSTPTGVSNEAGFSSYFCTAWREFAKSPLVLLFVLFYSVGVLCNWFAKDAHFLQIDTLLRTLGFWSMSTFPYRNAILTAIYIIDMLPSTLTAVGIWMTCADAWDKKDRPIRLGGLKLVVGLEVLNMIILGLSFCIALFMAGRAFFMILVLAGAVMAVLWVRVAVNITVRDTARDCMPETRYVKALAVIQLVSGGLNVLRVISGTTEDNIGSLINCIVAFLLGMLLLKYREFMGELDAKRVEMEAQSATACLPEETAKETECVPAWKRVQMEKENSEK